MNQLWLWVVSILGTIFVGLKLRGDHYKNESEQKEEYLAGVEAEGSLGAFNAAQEERHKQAQKEINKKESNNETDDTVITTSID